MAAGDLPITFRSICSLTSCLLVACKLSVLQRSPTAGLLTSAIRCSDALPSQSSDEVVVGHPRAPPTP